MRTIPTLPPTYQYSRQGKRIQVSYLRDGLRYPIPGYWLTDKNAACAAWKHYQDLQERSKNDAATTA